MTTVTSKSIPKLHIVFVGFLLFLSLLIPSVASHFVSVTNQLEELTAVQREIDKLDRISYSAVTDMTTYNNDSQVTYINIVLVKPLRSTGDSKIAVEACKIIKKFYPRAYDRDFINVQFSYGNDIGIASYWENVQVLRVNRGHLCG